MFSYSKNSKHNAWKRTTCLGDIAQVCLSGSTYEGTVTSISERGIVLKSTSSSFFSKWCHVFHVKHCSKKEYFTLKKEGCRYNHEKCSNNIHSSHKPNEQIDMKQGVIVPQELEAHKND